MRMPAVLAGARVNEIIVNHAGQPERVIEFMIGEQSSVGGDPGAMKLGASGGGRNQAAKARSRSHPPGPSSVSPPDAVNTLIFIDELVQIHIN